MMIRTFLAAILAALFPAAAVAGTVTLHKLDIADGPYSENEGAIVVGTGEMQYAPRFVVAQSDPYIIDACGNVAGMEEDRYGDRALGSPFYSNKDLANLVAIEHDGNWGLDSAGKLYQLRFKGYDPRYPSTVNLFNGEPIPEAKVFIHAERNGEMFIDDKGRLVEMSISGNSIGGLRRVRNAGNMDGVSVGINAGQLKDGHPTRALFLATGSGEAKLFGVDDDGTNISVKPLQVPFPGDFSGTRMFFDGQGSKNAVFRLTDQGDIYKVSFTDNTQTKLELPAPVHGTAAAKDHRHIFYVSTSGSFEACPSAEVTAVATEPEKKNDRGLFALLARLEGQAGKHNALFDEVEKVADYAPADVQTVEQYQQFYGPLAEKAGQFNTTIGRMIAQDRDSLENDFQDDGGPARFLSELTDGEQRDTSIPVSTLLSDYRDYLDDVATIAGRLEQTASTRNMIAEFQNSADDKVNAYKTAREFARLALLFDANLGEAHDIIRNTDQYVADALAAEQKALEENNWPAPFAHFDGPGNAADLENAAYKYLHDKRGDESVLRVQLRGDWYVWQTNLVGEPLNYCLPVHIGMADATYDDRGQVVEGEVCTRFNRMAPPFSFAGWSSIRYVIQKSRIN